MSKEKLQDEAEVILEQDTEVQTEETTAENEADAVAAELETVKDRLLRVSAEYDNFRKRTVKEKEELSGFAVGRTIASMLPVIDNFERAMEVGCSDEEFFKGMELILTQMKDSLTAMGVEEIATDVPFDPEVHNAVMHVEDENLGENVITAVMQKGYKLKDRVIRHAMVAVAN